MLVIVADVHERASGVPLALQAMGARVEVRALTRGDYVAGPETVVERKTIADLHSSIAAGRFWHQMRKVRDAGRWPYLIVEGQSIFRGSLAPSAVRGLCLAVNDLGIAIIRTENQEDTAAWLLKLADRRRDGAARDRPPYAQRPKPREATSAEAALAAAAGVSVVTARKLLRRYGSIRAIGEARVDDLQTISGVGIKRATAIVALIRNRWDSGSAH